MDLKFYDLLHGFEVLSTTEETLFNSRNVSRLVQNMENILVWNGIWNGKFLVWNGRNFAVWNMEKSSAIPFHSMPCFKH